MDDKNCKYVKLIRSSKYGFGFSIIGGAGSDIPPVIYDIVSGSPAAASNEIDRGDIILEINGHPAASYSTREVLNCLRDSPNELVLKLKLDRETSERVQKFLVSNDESGLLRHAITRNDLHGINRVVVKHEEAPPVPSKTLASADKKERFKQMHQHQHQSPSNKSVENGCLDDSFEDKDEHFQSCMDIPNIRGSLEFGMTVAESTCDQRTAGDLVLDISNKYNLTETRVNCNDSKCSKLTKLSDSNSVPNSPSALVDTVCTNFLSKNSRFHKHLENRRLSSSELILKQYGDLGVHKTESSSSSSSACVSCESPASAVPVYSLNSAFTYSPPSVRISRSEDQLQCPGDGNITTANTDLEDDVTSSLNTLLDTRYEGEILDRQNDQSTNPLDSRGVAVSSACVTVTTTTISAASCIDSLTTSNSLLPLIPISLSSVPNSATLNSLLELSPCQSTHSSHESDSPLLRSPSPPHSPGTPSSSLQVSSNGVYDPFLGVLDGTQSGWSGNICSHSSSVATSPDTDIPDELEWDETTPVCHLNNVSVGSETCLNAARPDLVGLSTHSEHSKTSRHGNSKHVNHVNIDTSSSSSSSLPLHEKSRLKIDENRIVIRVAGPDKNVSALTPSNNALKGVILRRQDSASSNDRSTSSSRRLRKDDMAVSRCSETGVGNMEVIAATCAAASVASILTSTCCVGVIPGFADPEITPTNTPHPTPPLSPSRSLTCQKALPEHYGIPRRQSSAPIRSSCSPPPFLSPETPGSGTVSPETLAYHELFESEDEISSSFVSDDASGDCASARSHGSTHSHNSLQHSSSSSGGGGSSCTVANVESVKALSPPPSEDESDIESLHSFHYSPKAVDIPSAVRLAKRLYHLDGFKKSDVSRHLSKNNEFSRAVAEEYLLHFDLTQLSLDQALRNFLDRFCLAGETQERERVLMHFSKRYLDCNPGTFNSQDAVHTLTCALMLLNTDLHSVSTLGRAMSCTEFINNLAELNDGQDFCPKMLRQLYASIKNNPLKWAVEESGEGSGQEVVQTSPAAPHSSNPFLSPVAGDGIIYKKGYVMRKCCTDPNGKKTSFGKRSWKMWWCVVQDLVLYLYKDEQCSRRSSQQTLPQLVGSQAMRLHHALATRAHDYSKKQHVFRLHTVDQAEYLFQTSDSKELQGWIDTINLVAASLSAPPMAGAVGSQRKFQRPLLPCSITKFSLQEQTADHQTRLLQLEADLKQHLTKPPDRSWKNIALSNYREKEIYLNEEIKRYRAYVFLLLSRLEAGDASVLQQDLPIFQADSPDATGEHCDGRVVPPPVPDRGTRATACDRYSYQQAVTNHALFQTTAASVTEKVTQSDDVGNDEFQRELVKIEKNMEKNMQKEQHKQKKMLDKLNKNAGKDIQRENDSSDPGFGKFNKLAALFKFCKLNKVEIKEEIAPQDNGNCPPPLPPKPSMNSPIRRNVGTKFDL